MAMFSHLKVYIYSIRHFITYKLITYTIMSGTMILYYSTQLHFFSPYLSISYCYKQTIIEIISYRYRWLDARLSYRQCVSNGDSNRVQIMACHLAGAKPLSEPILEYCQIGPLGTNFSEILTEIQNFSFMKMHLKMSSAKWRPFYPGKMKKCHENVSTITRLL